MAFKSPFRHNTSSIEREQAERDQRALDGYRFHEPWEQSSSYLIHEHERRVAAESYRGLEAPWDRNEAKTPVSPERLKARVASYKYVPLHAPLEPSPAQVKAMREYRSNPPFRVEDNYDPASDPSRVKRNVVPPPRTVPPWEHGKEPLRPGSSKKMVGQRSSTALWDKPPPPQRPIESSGDPVLDKLRTQLLSFGAAGILGLARKFRLMDDDGSGSLSLEEFSKGLRECRLELSSKETSHLFRYFDRDDSGEISYDEFLVGVRGVLTKRRRELVELAFRILDRDGSGEVTIEDLAGVYDTSLHRDFISGKRTEKEILLEFLSNFDVGGLNDGVVILTKWISVPYLIQRSLVTSSSTTTPTSLPPSTTTTISSS